MELLGELHLEVMVEYVRQMMKRKLKLKGKKQEEAAEFMCQDSRRICSMFANTGSNERWLSEILPRLSEILRLQDPGSLKLEIVALARIYPDLSEQHVVAVLTLKSNLSSSDVCGIKDCLRDNRETQDDQSSPSFFSKVIVKKNIF
ncbi:tumor necrosis factor alpha-induced protein 2-like [Misgurnus anguillicaudatus]|uniref:tumor necrosis factor alpha-induced protein 2-like n=1 Tax=Misgurnus anguillicaudatus TaxID=75329 RepID=UPI003CCF73E0